MKIYHKPLKRKTKNLPQKARKKTKFTKGEEKNMKKIFCRYLDLLNLQNHSNYIYFWIGIKNHQQS